MPGIWVMSRAHVPRQEQDAADDRGRVIRLNHGPRHLIGSRQTAVAYDRNGGPPAVCHIHPLLDRIPGEGRWTEANPDSGRHRIRSAVNHGYAVAAGVGAVDPVA